MPGWIVRAGALWRMLSHDLPPEAAVYQQTQRWMHAGVFETMVHVLRVLIRWWSGSTPARSVGQIYISSMASCQSYH